MKTNHLTIKQEAFAQAYLKLGDASKAYREAGYSYTNKKAETVWQEANRVLNNPKVAARIKELQAVAAKIADEKFGITSEEMLRHLNILRNARIDEYVEYKKGQLKFKDFDKLTEEQLMCIESIKQNRYGEIELKLHGKEWSIEKINKHIGFYAADNSQKANILLPDDRENRIKELRDKLNQSK